MAARDENPDDRAGGDHTRDALVEAMREQKQRQERLRHVQAFLTSPLFLDMRDMPVLVSDPPEAIEERKRDLDYRITVLSSLVDLLREERNQLNHTRSTGAMESEATQKDTRTAASTAAPDPSQA
jgi:hypothetical protein